MMVGIFVCASTWYYEINGNCESDMVTNVLGGAMYASYFYLFVVFALGRFCASKSSVKSGKGKKEGGAGRNRDKKSR